MGNILNRVPDKNSTNLMGFIDENYVEETPFGWDDMPEFDQPEQGQYHLLRVRFDCEEDLKEFAKKVEQNITSKTKAILPVHLAGKICKMPKIRKIAKDNDLWLIEDCAHAIGTKLKNKHAGTFGDAGAFSFHPVKIIARPIVGRQT